MKSIYEEKVANIMDNYLRINKKFLWNAGLAKHLVALTYTMKDKEIDVDKIKKMKDYIKNKTRILSSFRGDMRFILSGLLCANSDDDKEQFDFMIENEKMMKDAGFKSTDYLPMALYTLSSTYDGDDVIDHVEKAITIYKEMKSNHPFLTSGDDYALAILLANTDYDMDIIQEYYKELSSQGFKKSNGLQMLSHILAFSERDVLENRDICLDILYELKKNKLKIDPEYYPAIGIICLLPGDTDELKSDLIEVTKLLEIQNKYKWLDKGMNVLIAASLMASEYVKDQTSENVISASLNISTQVMIAAQQV